MMRKILVSFGCWLMATGLLLLVGSCDIEMSDNGDLDGMWQLTAVDTLSTKGHRDMRETNTTWNIQGKLLQLRSTDLIFSCNFSREGESLKLGTIYVTDHHDEPHLEDLQQVGIMGVNRQEERFDITTLTSSSMTLQSSMLKLSFRKY